MQDTIYRLVSIASLSISHDLAGEILLHAMLSAAAYRGFTDLQVLLGGLHMLFSVCSTTLACYQRTLRKMQLGCAILALIHAYWIRCNRCRICSCSHGQQCVIPNKYQCYPAPLSYA